MRNFNLTILYICAILTMCVTYATQPLQPHFEEILEISKFQASLFTTAILIPLAFSSIFYGYLLEKFSIKKILIFAFIFFSITEFIFANSKNYIILILIRITQGFVVPAALTGIISYISQTAGYSKVAKMVSIYIAMTILGGFLGRFLSGFLSDFFGWQFFFYVLSAILFIIAILLYFILGNITASFVKPKLRYIPQILSIKRNLYIFCAIFGVFFVFQAILNILPFELMKLNGEFNGSKTGLMYIGYTLGILISLNSTKIVNLLKTPSNAVFIGIFTIFISLLFLQIENFYIIFTSMLIFYIGSFTAHSIATAYINKKAIAHKGITNGLYISFYYTGGALGSFAPGFIYEFGNWHIFLIILNLSLIFSLFFIWKLKNYEYSKILS